MALYTNYSLFIDVENGVASKSFQDVNQLVNPAFFHNDRSVLNVYFVKPNNYGSAPYEEVVISGLSSVNAAIGVTNALTSTSGLTALDPATVTVTTVVSYTAGVNQIDRISINPAPKGGSFSLVYDGSNLLPTLSVNATASEVQAALESFLGTPTLTDNVTVTKVGDFTWDVTYNANTLAPPAALTALSGGIISFTGYQIVMDLTPSAIDEFLAGAASKEALLEISTTQTSPAYVQTALQIPCTVYSDIL